MALRILVIKLGALGNVVLSLGPFAAIRRHHAQAEITLMTTAPYANWLAGSPYFDRVWIDSRPNWWDIHGWLGLRRRLLDGRFDRVYDLQTSARTNWYFRLMQRARPEWSGIARGCSHPDKDPNRNRIHDLDRQIGQLRQAGTVQVPDADLSWSSGEISRFRLPKRIALLVPGSSAHRPGKRWPAAHYRALAAALYSRGLTPVLLGAASESRLAGAIAKCTPCLDLIGRTDFGDLASLARVADLAVGNDTGPMHLIASAGCRSVILFSAASDPRLCAPRGKVVQILRCSDLGALELERVLEAASRYIKDPIEEALV
jgi:ADP-heptose:LPS heptosyltransferase